MDSRRSSVLAHAALAAGLLLALPAAVASAQVGSSGRSPGQVLNFLHDVHVTRVMDPKLDGGDLQVDYRLDQTTNLYDVSVTVTRNVTGALVATLFSGREHGGDTSFVHHWNGRDAVGAYVDPGQYTVTVEARNVISLAQKSVDSALTIARLGIRNISFESTGTSGANEWQTVYFRKDGKYAFYATPATGEWLSKNDTGEISDLDLDNSSPRPAPTVHTTTDEPVLDPVPGKPKKYDDHYHNYPICYLAGAAPRMTVQFGFNATLANGTKGGCKYPISGVDLRCVASDEAGNWTTSATSISPGGTETLDGPALTTQATRTKRHVEFRWQYREAGATNWSDVAGTFTTPIRFYTILDKPYWASGASGTQYSGPWVEVLEYLYDFSTALNVTCNTSNDVVQAFIQGFFGQQASLTTAIEGVEYDCPSVGGDGGATHYVAGFPPITMHLSKLLNSHDLGIYVNCTDCASSTSTMLSMLGISNIQLDHLGFMQLNAIWGIGTPDYTLDLWGGGNNSFSYHHIITRDGGTTISDGCLCVDEDGDPTTLPGTPGYNNDRDWNNYESLVATNNVTWSLEAIPKLD
jgi:hypothetical protein